jgi:hypothetical protein
MKTISIPFVYKRQKSKFTRIIFDNPTSTNFETIKKELKNIYNSINDVEVPFNIVFSDVINSNINNVKDNHYVITINNVLKIKLINIHKIPQFHSVESIARSID